MRLATVPHDLVRSLGRWNTVVDYPGDRVFDAGRNDADQPHAAVAIAARERH
jgi:hypothetical protein